MLNAERPTRSVTPGLPARSALFAFFAFSAFGICHLALTPVSAAAQPAPPALTDTVNDFANIIDGSSRTELDRRIRALKETTGDVLIVATVPTYQPYGSIEEYAVKMFENGGRGIGEKGKDNGMLLLVAVDDRKVKVETGYDLEGIIPDGFAGQTIRETIVPAFRQQRYGPGLLDATTRFINRIAEQRNVTIPDVPVTRPQRAQPISIQRLPWPFIIWVLIIVIGLSRGNRRRRRRYWGGGPWSNWSGGVGPFGGGGFGGGGFGGFGGGGGGGGGGGFGGFGGGRSGGGGASGSW
jgi:uncharacterized protein